MKKKQNRYNYIMGVQCFANQDSGACLLRYSSDEDVLDFVAISEERLIRKKHPYVFPVHSIGYCLDYYGLETMSEVDLLVSDYIRVKRWFNSGPGYPVSEYDYLKLKLDFDPRNIVTISHHMAHAASVYYTSGFDEAAILIVDGNGSDLQTTSFFDAEHRCIRYIDEYKAHGIGAVYNAVTQEILGFGTGGEGKTMGLAPFGEAHEPVLDLQGELDGIRNNYSKFVHRQPWSDVLNYVDDAKRISPLRNTYLKPKDQNSLLNPYFSRVAYDIQQETERVLVHLGREIEKRTQRKKICLAGGVALNSVANKIMYDKTNFEDIFVFPACSDSGIPFGLAIWGYYNAKELGNFDRRKLKFRNAYTGKPYSERRILNMFERYKIPFKKASPREVAILIAEGNIFGWFQGGSEYGPRALGHRSILADPRNAEMTAILNKRVKHRETFRPFAPAVLLENSSEYFDLDCPSPYMLLVAKVLKPNVIPAVTHVDGTARVQTLTQAENGIFYDLVKEFYKITGVPVILNTSFNDAGEPIVETPEDAMICFLKTEMDYLVIGEYLVSARDINKIVLADKMASLREAQIASRFNHYLTRYFPDFSTDECEDFIKKSNHISVWHVRYRSKFLLEEKTLGWIRNESRILIVGSRDHTALLNRYINKFHEVNVVGFIDTGDACKPEGKDEDLIFEEFAWNKLDCDDYDEILISSFEYMYDILDRLQFHGVKKQIYSIYDSSSRSFFETLTTFPPYKLR